MLKTLVCFYSLFSSFYVNILGEQFQACDSSSDENEVEYMSGGEDWKNEVKRMKEAMRDPNQRPYIPTNIQIPCRTQHFAQLTWSSGAAIRTGGTVKYKDILGKPKVVWPCRGSKRYGLVFANMDAVLKTANTGNIDDREWKEYLWFMFNIPGNKVDQGIEVKPYRPPSMDKGSCRVVVAVHEQNQQIDIGSIDNSALAADKAFFEVFKTFNGTLVAGNMFTVENCELTSSQCTNYNRLLKIIFFTVE